MNIVIRLAGGIGNQLFQYAFGEYLRLKTGKDVRYDISPLEKSKSPTLRPCRTMQSGHNVYNNLIGRSLFKLKNALIK